MAKTLLRESLTPEEAERYKRWLDAGWTIFKEIGGSTSRVVMERPLHEQLRRARLTKSTNSTERDT